MISVALLIFPISRMALLSRPSRAWMTEGAIR